MAYSEFDMKFSERKPPKLHKNEIDGMYIQERNNGRFYMPTLTGPIHIDDWREEMYVNNGIHNNGI